MINNFMVASYLGMISAVAKIKGFIADETHLIKNDESGMELIQVILIIALVVVIALGLWGWLSGWIGDLIEGIEEVEFNAPGW